MENRFSFCWNVDALAKAFQVNNEDIEEYLSDGRRVSFIIERRLQWDHPTWTRAPSEGASYDLMDPEGNKWEVRSITKDGVYFTPSNQVGAGRKFNQAGFVDKLSNIKGFILADIFYVPRVDVYKVPKSNVARWYESGILGKNAKISHKKFHAALKGDIRV